MTPTPGGSSGLTALPARGVGEVRAGDDLVELLAAAWRSFGADPRDGDVIVVTSKVVSKAEGRSVPGDTALVGPSPAKDAAVRSETDRELARRGPTRIVRTRHGFVMAAAGVDASNVAAGSLLLLPVDPDASARRIREGFQARGACVGVVVSDTVGRAWRLGQTDLALGAAGLVVLDDHAGRSDGYGNALAVTAPAVADEIASAGELATGKLSGSPACLLRGLDRFVLPAGRHGAGAAVLVRPEESDMFGLGAREAVAAASAAVTAEGGELDTTLRGFGAAASAAELLDSVRAALPQLGIDLDDGSVVVRLPADPFEAGRQGAVAVALLAAHGWRTTAWSRNTVLAAPRP